MNRTFPGRSLVAAAGDFFVSMFLFLTLPKDPVLNQRQLERAVARQTGESLATIRSRGFSIVEPPELEPLTVDWDEIQAERVALFPGYERQRRAA